MKSIITALILGTVVAAATSSTQAAVLATTCGTECTWSIAVDGTQVGSGDYVANPAGVISGSSARITLGGGAWVQLNNLSGDLDPILGFSATANTGALGKTFAFTFTMPIALEGPLMANSSVSYSLTSATAAGAQITPLVGHTVLAQEVDTDVGGLLPLNKGVDVGTSFSFVGGPQTRNSPIYTAANTLTGNLMYDLMSVTVAFSLSANSNVGFSGFVQQELDPNASVGAVPLPAAAWLLVSGLAGLGVVGRRNRH